jgi:hypothetical protein
MVQKLRPCVAVNANGFAGKKPLQAVRKCWRTIVRGKQQLGFADEQI